MKILFTTRRRDAPSSTFIRSRLLRLSDVGSVAVACDSEAYEDYDVVLFMGYDPQVAKARTRNPGAVIGIIDPRPGSRVSLEGADFVLANGWEMADYYSGFPGAIFQYYIVPDLPARPAAREAGTRIVIGYHGNRVHLDGMFPRVTCALEQLAREFPVEVRLMYDIEGFGRWRAWNPTGPMTLRHVQWTDDGYVREMATCHIGIVPGLIPIQRSAITKMVAATLRRRYNEEPADYLLRFKPTSNPARALVFAHFGIPVVADVCPSFAQFIQHGRSGFLCYGTDSWVRALRQLAASPDLREQVGATFNRDYKMVAALEVQNRDLLAFLSIQLQRRQQRNG